MALRILKMSEVRECVPFCKATIYLKVRQGEFPAPVSLGARAVGWLESDIEAWIAARVEASTSEQTAVHQ